MQYAFRGHMVIIAEQNTAADGEAIAEGFRRLGLGVVIGMRTWGGEILLGSSNRPVSAACRCRGGCSLRMNEPVPLDHAHGIVVLGTGDNQIAVNVRTRGEAHVGGGLE